jgi:dipeptidyl aminopeptidase/acylaminoacyl peptidase
LGRAGLAAILASAAVACSAPPQAAKPTPGVSPTTSPSWSPSAAPGASPSPADALPPYYIESLRRASYPGGRIEIGERMLRGGGFTKYRIRWPSQGQVMTGTLSLPDGPGPFPVVIVNHGFIPANRYWVGQDSGIFGDPMAAHGMISLAPDYPGYAGSGQLDPALPTLVATVVSVMDLISSLPSLPQADPARVAMMGHSNGGGVSLMLSVVDPRVKALALFAPISSDMADNAKKWWRGPTRGSVPSPEEAPDAYRHMSPRFYFNASTPPAIFLQGTLDEDIPAEWTNATIQALRDKGVEALVTWYPGARHDMVGADLADAGARAESFIRAHLG